MLSAKHNGSKLALAGILLLTVVVFYPSLDNGFTNWDDTDFIVDNPLVHDAGMSGLYRILVTYKVESFAFLHWAIDYHLVGAKPFLYHFTNLVLHLVITFLFYALVMQWSKNNWIALTATLIYAIHPLHVEPVAWITGRTYLWYACFFWLTVLSYLRYYHTQQWSWYGLAIAGYVFALLSFPTAMALAPSLFLLDYLYKRKIDKKALLEKIPFFAFAVISGLLTLTIREDKTVDIEDYGIFERIAISAYSYIYFLVKLILPYGLSGFYPYPDQINGNLPSTYFIYPIMALIILIATVFSMRYGRAIFFAVMFYTLNILPSLRLIPVMGEYMTADRYTYVSQAGLIWLIAVGLHYCFHFQHRFAPVFRILIIGITGIGILASGIISFNRSNVWQDSISFWSDVIRKYPQATVAYLNRGNAYQDQGRSDLAFEDYNRLIGMKPGVSKSYNDRGFLHYSQGNYEMALSDYNHALSQDPQNAEALNNRGVLYQQIGNFEQAMKDLNLALQIDPALTNAYNNRGNLFRALQNPENALADYGKALELNPEYHMAYLNRGILYYRNNAFELALKDLNQSIQLAPGQPQAYRNRGNIYRKQGNMDAAESDYRKAISLKPDYWEAYDNLAMVLSSTGRSAAAMAAWSTCLKIKPDAAGPLFNRAFARFNQGDLPLAIEDLSLLIDYHPDFGRAYQQRALAYYHLKDLAAAKSDADKAAALGFPISPAIYQTLGQP